MDSAEDVKADMGNVVKMKEEAKGYYEELEKLCTQDVDACARLAPGFKGKCDAISRSMPFEP